MTAETVVGAVSKQAEFRTIMFGFIGGISGVVLGTEQLNLLMHNTLYVPGHFHHEGKRSAWPQPTWCYR